MSRHMFSKYSHESSLQVFICLSKIHKGWQRTSIETFCFSLKNSTLQQKRLYVKPDLLMRESFRIILYTFSFLYLACAKPTEHFITQ